MVKVFIRTFYILSFSAFCFSSLVSAQEPQAPEQSIEAQYNTIRLILANQPSNRTARYRLAETAFQLGRFEEARFHLDRLINTSNSPQELMQLKSARAEVIAKSPFATQFRFALLPSTNIGKNPSETEFLTSIGELQITGGGEEESGIGYTIGGSLSFEFTNGAKDVSTIAISLDQANYPADRLDRRQTGLRYNWTRQNIGSTIFAQLYVSETDYIEEVSDGSDLRQYGGLIGRQVKLNSEGDSVTYRFQHERRDYITNDRLDGPYSRLSLDYANVTSPKTRWTFGASLERSNPNNTAFAYNGVGGRVEYLAQVSAQETLGLNYSYSQRDYRENFTAVSFPRQDITHALGFSLRTTRIKIWDSVPRLSCTYSDVKSNIELYTYQSTDCAISFSKQF